MKSKIIIGVAAILIAAGAFVYAHNKKTADCPNTPDCVCHPQQ